MDDELQAIRARRLAELQKNQGRQWQMEEMREMVLAQILDNDARQRLTRIAMVKADKARGVEDMLIRMAKTGQLRGKVSEQQLIELLEQLSEQTKRSEPKIVFNRRRDYDDDEDDEDYNL
ncbi:hypothetical protein H4R35_003439 [Dimargaris xerosporica]|nr:hypothetical protein H4R35_003439 [Dimargaris xerosporica]